MKVSEIDVVKPSGWQEDGSYIVDDDIVLLIDSKETKSLYVTVDENGKPGLDIEADSWEEAQAKLDQGKVIGRMVYEVELDLDEKSPGGPGSGHFGHGGRPGQVGGSAPAGEGAAPAGWSKDRFGVLTREVGNKKAWIRKEVLGDEYRLQLSKDGLQWVRESRQTGILHDSEKLAISLANRFFESDEGFIPYTEWFARVDELPKKSIAEKKVDITENSIRVRVVNPDKFQKDSFRTITIDEDRGIQAVIARPKGKDTTKVQTFIFDKEKWTPARAQQWVTERESKKEQARKELAERLVVLQETEEKVWYGIPLD